MSDEPFLDDPGPHPEDLLPEPEETESDEDHAEDSHHDFFLAEARKASKLQAEKARRKQK